MEIKKPKFVEKVWGSEEWPEYLGSQYIDAFGLYVNGFNIASVDGKPVNIDHPDMAPIPGTELNAVLAPGDDPLNLFSYVVGDGAEDNTLIFIIADTGDEILDSTVYLSQLGGTEPPNGVPEPSFILLLGSGLIGMAGFRRKFRKE